MWLRALVRTRACYIPSPGKKNSWKNAVLGRPVLRLIEPCVLVLGGFSGRGEAEPQGPRLLVLDPILIINPHWHYYSFFHLFFFNT